MRKRIVGKLAATRHALMIRKTRLGTNNRRVCATVHPWACLSVTGNRRVNKFRVECRKRGVVEPKFFHYTWAEIFNENVGVHDQLLHNGNSFRLRHVERNIFLARVLLNEIGRQRVHSRVCETRKVAIWRLNFDDLGSKVAQHARGMRPCKYTAEIENAQTL